jgi:hypothetical protein
MKYVNRAYKILREYFTTPHSNLLELKKNI